MRFMMIVKASQDSEAGTPPSAEMLTEMGKFNEEMVKAGILRDGAGLQPSSKGARVTFSRGETTVTDGPFAETKELIAGFWIIEVASRQEAIAWARRCPPPMGPTTTAQIELRPLFESADFPEATAEMLAHEQRLAEQIKKQR